MQSLAAWDKFVNSRWIPGSNIRRVLKISFHIKQMLCTGRGRMVIHMRGVCPAHSGQKIIHKMVQAGVHILCGKAAVLVRPSGVKIRRDGALKAVFNAFSVSGNGRPCPPCNLPAKKAVGRECNSALIKKGSV